MRITPGPGTVVVIVHHDGEENHARVGRMTGRAGAISAAPRPDLPPLPSASFVVLLAKVANQKMMAEGVYSGERDGHDDFQITRSWAPSDNRRDPRLPVRVKAEVRLRGVRGTIPAVICDLSAGGAKIEVESDALRGEIDLLVRYGGFSATLPAYVLSNDDDDDESGLAPVPEESAEEDPGEEQEPGATGDGGEAPTENIAADEAVSNADEAVSKTDGAEPNDAQAPPDSDADEEPAMDVAEAPVAEPEPPRKRRRFEKVIQPTMEVRVMFDELDLPQQGFLRHMLRDVAEISGWELAS